MSRAFRVPEVLQTSAMDCGPAVLTAALEGMGVEVDPARLRTACQTDVDGTSIDTLGLLAADLGLPPVQTLVPVDHLALPEALPLPAVLVTARPDGQNHFVLLWRRVGGWVQLLDPAVGRRWLRWSRLLPEVYRHHMQLPPDTFGAWVQSPAFFGGLTARCKRLGAGDLLDTVADLEDALLTDASIRTAESLLDVGALARGAEARRFVQALREDPGLLLPENVVARPNGGVSGAAVVLQLQPPERVPEPTQRGLREALAGRRERPTRRLHRELAAVGPHVVAASLVVGSTGAIGGLVQAALLRALFDANRWLQTPLARTWGVAALVGVSAGTVLLGYLWGRVVNQLSRRFEIGLRVRLHTRLPEIEDSYLSTRLTGDLAERAHSLSALKALPGAVGALASTLAAVLATLAGLVVLDPGLFPLILVSVLASVGLPVLLHPLLTSRELRRQTLDGSLSRVYLDAMVGASAVRAHNAEEALRREHEALLTRWQAASRDALVASVASGALQSLVGMGLAVAMVASHLARAEHAGATLLLVYWAVALPRQGSSLALAARQVPALQSLGMRVFELLDAPTRPGGEGPGLPEGAWSIRAEDLEIQAGGQVLLHVPSLRVEAGEHVAIVGSSGAGKSTLIHTLLGLHEPKGILEVAGLPLDADANRRRTVWVDPQVRLWNDSLLANLRYGNPPDAVDLAALLEEAGLVEVLAGLPEGLSQSVGEAGGLLSGGQGQRVRLARAFGRPDVALALLDEPFRGLDRTTRRALLARAREHWADATLLTVTHDVRDVLGFPRVLVVEDGRIVQDGAPDALRAQPGRFAELLAADQALDSAFAGDWRRWSLEAGRLVEAT